MTGPELLHEHVERFNAGVRSREWEPMLELFAEDGELRFEGIPAGPYAGRETIAAAYRERPPDDEIRVEGGEEPRPGLVTAPFAWLRGGSGRLLLEHENGLIHRLTVMFDPEEASAR